ncbi:hypothetical protein DV736_g2043, partial [Chaetothyriales sp. CBS 134916]
MADTNTSETPTHETRLTTGTRLVHKQQQVALFVASASDQQLDALERFLTTTVLMKEMAAIIPPAEDVQIRQELAQQLQDEIRSRLDENDWQFTASYISTILVMPIDTLRNMAQSGRMSYTPAEDVLKLSGDLAYECQIFEIKLDSKDDAEKMKDMIDLQWALIVMASIAGAADPPELDDDDDNDNSSDYGPMEVDPGPTYDRGRVQEWLQGAEAATSGQTGTSPGKLPDIPSVLPSPLLPPAQDPTTGPSVLGAVTNLPRRQAGSKSPTRTSPERPQTERPFETY